MTSTRFPTSLLALGSQYYIHVNDTVKLFDPKKKKGKMVISGLKS